MLPLKKFLSVGLWCLVTCPQLVAQDSTRSYKFELTGTFGYTYSHEKEPDYFFQRFERASKEHSISFIPSFGYFFSNDLELLIEVQYQYRASLVNNYIVFSTSNSDEFREVYYNFWSHQVGLNSGILYNNWVSSSVALFAGPLGGISVGKRYDGRIQSYIGWQKPEFSFPIILFGTRILLGNELGIMLQIRYSHAINRNGYEPVKADLVRISVGIILLLVS